MAAGQKAAQIADACSQSWACVFADKAADLNLGVVLIGGVAGGLLQPIYARLNPDRKNPPSGHFLWSALLGLAAAGISVYVVANSNTTEPVRLLFFSLLCGLAFPSVLTSAVDSVSKRTEEMQRDMAVIAQQARSNEIADTAEAANQLKTTLARHPAETINAGGVSVVEASAQIAVQNIAETANTNPETASSVVNQLQQVGTVARTTGYEATANAVADELKKLSSGADIDDAAKDAAREAARRLKGNP